MSDSEKLPATFYLIEHAALSIAGALAVASIMVAAPRADVLPHIIFGYLALLLIYTILTSWRISRSFARAGDVREDVTARWLLAGTTGLAGAILGSRFGLRPEDVTIESAFLVCVVFSTVTLILITLPIHWWFRWRCRSRG